MILTPCEYNTNANRVLLKFACAQFQDAITWKWKMKKYTNKPEDSKLLWLFVYALNTYDTSVGAINYITEQQAMAMFAKANSILL